MKNPKKERRKQKKKQKEKRDAKKKNRALNISVDQFYYTDHQMAKDFISAMNKEVDRVRREFWRRFSGWHGPIRQHINGTKRLRPGQLEYFLNESHHYARDIVQEVFFEHYPRYRAFNYSVELFTGTSGKLLHFDVDLNVLDTQSTEHGIIHMLPGVLFPANKPVGVTTHAIERMDTRVLSMSGDTRHRIGGALRCNLLLIPYIDNVFGLYMCSGKTRRCVFNGKQEPAFALLGYLTIKEHDEYFVGVTHLAPGFWQTPEKCLPEKDIGNYRMLVSIDGVVHRAMNAAQAKANSKGVIELWTTPYELHNPHIHLINRFKDRV